MESVIILRHFRQKIRLSCQVYCSVLQCVAVCCSVLQCVAVCCSVLQCVALRHFRQKIRLSCQNAGRLVAFHITLCIQGVL